MRTPRKYLRMAMIASLTATTTAIAGCGHAGPPAQFMRTTNESGIWKQIEIRDELQNEKAKEWSTVVDALSTKYDLEVLDKESGYLRTSWKFTAVGTKEEREHYRSRLIAKFNGAYSVLQLKSEAQWLNEGVWETGYDTQMLDDVYGDLQARLGRTRQ